MNNNETHKGYFYILANKRKNVLYAGSTKDLINRVREHQKGYQKGFTQKYNVNQLIYYEIFENIAIAKNREKEIKGWKREKKVELIESKNKQWKDLFEELVRDPSL
jgi:putative endonuclease